MQDRPPEDAEREVHRARIVAAVEAYIGAHKTYIDTVLKRLLIPVTRWWTGTATAINTSNKTVRVKLDPFTEGPAPTDPVTCGWGRKSWSAGQIVGKRVRVMIDLETKAHWVDDVLE